MMNVGRLRCLQPRCRRGRPLYVGPGGVLTCPCCGATRAPRDYFRVYGARTAQWIVGGAVWVSIGYGRTGALRLVLLTLGALMLLYGLGRVLFQAVALRALRPRDGAGSGS